MVERDLVDELEAFAEGDRHVLSPLAVGAPLLGGRSGPRYAAVLRVDPRGYHLEPEADWPPELVTALHGLARSAGLRRRGALDRSRKRAPVVDERDDLTAARADVEGLRGAVQDDRILLAWMGSPGVGRLDARERRLLRALLAPLHRRLLLERGTAQDHTEAALAAALEAVPAAAYLVDRARGEVTGGNTAGRVFLERDRARVLGCVDQRPACPCGCSIVPLGHADTTSRYLVIRRPDRLGLDGRVTIAAARWRLSVRQALVLGLLAEGRTNKEIAAALRCAENTVEAHVTQLLTKAGADKRGCLLFRFWSET